MRIIVGFAAGGSVDLVGRVLAQRFSTGGPGTSPHIFLEMMKQMAGVNTEPIHYRGSAPAITGMIAGDAEFSASSIATAKAQIDGGKARAIAVTGTSPAPKLPDVSTIASAVSGFEALTFHGLHARAKTPPAIVAKIQRDAAKVMQRDDTRDQLGASSLDVSIMTSDEFSA